MSLKPLTLTVGVPLAAAVGAAILVACQSSSVDHPPSASPPTDSKVTTMNPPAASQADAALPAPGTTIRVGGDQAAQISGHDGDFRAGPCRIDTPLSAGYPPPTPPGAIDIKSYPTVRLAEVAGAGDPDRGKNRTFWPLFNHIKQHDIAMTSPVEMNYAGMQSGGATPQSWSMAFLYRTPDMNRPGTEGSVTVRDAAPITVVSAGMKGDYSMSLVQSGMKQIEDWLAAHPQWEPAGDWRSLYYNGPSFMFWNKWAEVQMPIRPSSRPTAGAPGAPSH